MRRSLRAAACTAILTLALAAAPAVADPSVCTQPLVTCDLAGAHCHAGDYVYVVVVGLDAYGQADCRGSVAECTGVLVCTDVARIDESDRLGCDLTRGLLAICFTLPVNVPVDQVRELVRDFADPTVCAVFGTLEPTVNVLPSLLYVAPDGDVYVANAPVYDCPPYS